MHFNPRTHEGCGDATNGTGSTMVYFNPRTHEGCGHCRIQNVNETNWDFNPRTHEGCGLFDIPFRRYPLDFNPRTHEGCGRGKFIYYVSKGRFQSTHPRRVRLPAELIKDLHDNISIHAPTKGAAKPRRWDMQQCILFQSTHPRRVRRYMTLI